VDVLDALALPSGVQLVRVTPVYDALSVPQGLLGAHRLAPGVWGLLRVEKGSVVFVAEETDERRRLVAGEVQVIEPDTLHHVEIGANGAFLVEFHR
jgi:tellurite resistance-related uncharacterized protein